MAEKEIKEKKDGVEDKKQCFVIMPISDPEGYEKGHFKYVYEDLLIPAIKEAGFEPKRADDDKSSSMIQINIIRDIIEAPMAICDLSSRNPNVLFELGIRQAFDLPVVLVQEQGTQRIFDISTINTIDYRKDLIYREVIEDREKIKSAIKATQDNTKGINSIIRLLEIGKAELKSNGSEKDDIKIMLYAILNRMDELQKEKDEIRSVSTNKSKLFYELYLKELLSLKKSLDENKSVEGNKVLQKSVEDKLIDILNNQALSEKHRNNLEIDCQILMDLISNKIKKA